MPRAYEQARRGRRRGEARRPARRVTGTLHGAARELPAPARHGARAPVRSGLDRISFLAADVSSEAFNRPGGWEQERAAGSPLGRRSAALAAELDGAGARARRGLRRGLHRRERRRSSARRLLQLLRGAARARAISRRSSATRPGSRSVVEADGTVRPCFFQPPLGNLQEAGAWTAILNSPAAIAWRRGLDTPRDADLPPLRLLAGAAGGTAMRRHRIVLYNPQAVFYTMPLALLAVGSHLDPERYEVVIVDARLEADPARRRCAPRLDGALCLGVTVLTGAPIARRRARLARGQGLPARPARGLGRLAPLALRPRVPGGAERGRHRAGAGRGHLPSSVDRLAAGSVRTGRLPGLHLPGAARRDPAEPAAPARATSTACARTTIDLLPVERYYGLKGKRQLDYISSHGCAFRCAFCADPFVYGRNWVGLDAGAHGRRDRRALAALPLRPTLVPG